LVKVPRVDRLPGLVVYLSYEYVVQLLAKTHQLVLDWME